MAPDDRDRTFEKALARHLRASASRSLDASSPAGAPARPSVGLCPDPEMLAAYHDGALSPEERNLWKQHVLSCDRCQLVLSHLETPLDIPVRLETGKNVEALQPALSAARTLSPLRIARPSPLHTLRWLWLVPAGAIAATLVVWVSLQEKKPVQVAPSSPVEIAENRQPPVAAPPAKTAPPSDRNERKEKDQAAATSPGTVAGAATADRDSALEDLRKEDLHKRTQRAQQTPSQYAPNPAHGPSLTAQKQEQQIGRIAAGRAGAFDQKKLDAPSATGALGGRSGDSLAKAVPALPPPPPPLPSSEPGFLADGSVSAPLKDQERSPAAPAPSSNSAALKTKAVNAANVNAVSAMAESVEVSGAPQSPVASRARLRAAALQNPHVFWVPGGKQAWRIGPAGMLEHSADKGLTWTPQISGVYTDLLAASTPSAKVCWIVGASGTILRTNDSGTHWTKLDSPVTNDFTGIRATDAKHALIWFVPDSQTGLITTYQTNDGGASWSLVSNP
jgi:hypothetical protein